MPSSVRTEKERGVPGVMLYASNQPLLEELEPETFKKLVLGMLNYVTLGVVPELDNSGERIAWAALSNHMNGDLRRYEKKCLVAKYNRFLREAEKLIPRGDCPDYEDWMELSENGARKPAEIISVCYERYLSLKNLPNTITISNT